MKDLSGFPVEIIEKLNNYVYRLIDPRNGETFYVGRGVGNRLFAHIKDELGNEADMLGDKLSRIREIRLAGFEVAHVVHRHGLEQEVAKEVEAALIDAYSGLANSASGEGSGERGVMHANEIIQEYLSEPAEFKHRALLISVNRSATEMTLYEAVRFSWKLSEARANQAELVLAVQKGIIRGVFIPEKWLLATPENFPDRLSPDSKFNESKARLAFSGYEADEEIAKLYVGKRLPDDIRFGTSNPIRYTW